METVKKAAEILKKLSPANQAYFMTLTRVAEVAQNNANEKTGAPEGQSKTDAKP